MHDLPADINVSAINELILNLILSYTIQHRTSMNQTLLQNQFNSLLIIIIRILICIKV